ncbi:MAG: hypothetical protein SPJ37_09885 [Sodaliphilus sp.]|jgi:hypothetical protein|nr:hypothetical protein [Muribaculaceae bacterium]MCI6985736.1 hypothetical protein [Bacteroidales bacterium]MDY2711065.1 hypothetical protein [Sodaliphilus sp.]MDD7052993.1 hypothetical protein [Bacteroidales bacterium]MDD7230201.1 hypothetical protein [Bacteroidales bacterium]
MTQKYKKNNSPAIQNGIFSSFPDVSQPNLSDFPDVLQPDLSDFPGVFWFKHGGNMFGASKKMGALGDEVAHTGYVENISCFRG